MKRRFGLVLTYLVVLYACNPVPVQYPPGAAPYPAGSSQYPPPNQSALPAGPAQPQEVTGSQRWQHAWSKAMEGVVMGGSIAGPYGAGGGLVIGLITGLFTADSHFGQINNQIHVEQKKDQRRRRENHPQSKRVLQRPRRSKSRRANRRRAPSVLKRVQAWLRCPSRRSCRPRRARSRTSK